MHIPDNYLSPQTCAVMAAAAAPAWGISISRIRKELPREKIPMMGVAAAFCFLGMMFNIPLPGGTTGHAVGGTLIALLLGPYAACISVSVALILQALLFGDGGVLAIGANCFNIAFVLPFVGYAVTKLIAPNFGQTDETLELSGAGGEGLSGPKAHSGKSPEPRRHSSKRDMIAAAVGSYAGINAAALCTAIEFGIQPMLFTDAGGNALYCPYGLNIALPAMMAGHLTVFGLAEVIFTLAILAFVRSAAPGMLGTAKSAAAAGGEHTGLGAAETRNTPTALKVLIGVLIMATPLGLLAEGTAWGEWGTDEIAAAGAGYTPKGMENGFSFDAIIPDYSMGGMPDWIGYILSAVIGVAVLVIMFKLLSLAGSRKGNA